MYNRYIPGKNGGYVRQTMEESPIVESTVEFPDQEPSPCWEPPEEPPCREKSSVFSRLKNLLPQGLDTGDLLVLIVVLLLLLEKDENNEELLPVLITAAAFLFLK